MSDHGSDTALNRESPGFFLCFSLFILILCIPVHEKNKHFLVWENVVSAHGAATALNRQKQKKHQGKSCLSLYEDL